MEYKTGVKWLTRARYINLQIKEKGYLIEALYTCCGLQGINYDKVSVMTSPDNKFEKIMAEIDERKRELEALQFRKAEIVREISSRIETLGDTPERTILMGFYVGCRDMEELSKDLGYELSWCYRLRRKGIERL